MTTSRTGTAKWKAVRRKAITQAKAHGITHCPLCHTQLDYDTAYTPTSAEVDHIVPHSKGGADVIDNAQVICRLCNQSRGNRPIRADLKQLFPLSQRW